MKTIRVALKDSLLEEFIALDDKAKMKVLKEDGWYLHRVDTGNDGLRGSMYITFGEIRKQAPTAEIHVVLSRTPPKIMKIYLSDRIEYWPKGK